MYFQRSSTEGTNQCSDSLKGESPHLLSLGNTKTRYRNTRDTKYANYHTALVLFI